jgi:drug/metabolite transporter (DMT)-like permease
MTFTRCQANGLLLLSGLLWGMGGVAQQTILADIGPITTVGLKCIIAAAVLYPVLRWSGAAPLHLDVPAKRLAALTVITFVAALFLFQLGIGYTTVTNASFLVNTGSVMTPFVAWFLLLARPDSMIWPAAAVTMLGTALMSGGMLHGLNIGDVICLLSAFFYSIWMVLLGVFVSKHGHALRISCWQFTIAAVICAPAGVVFETITLQGLRSALPELLILGLLSTSLAYLIQAMAQVHTSAAEAAIIVSSEAIFAAIGALILLGEVPTSLGIIGAFSIMAGILMIECPAHLAGTIFDRIRRMFPGLRPEAYFPATPQLLAASSGTRLVSRDDKKIRMTSAGHVAVK